LGCQQKEKIDGHLPLARFAADGMATHRVLRAVIGRTRLDAISRSAAGVGFSAVAALPVTEPSAEFRKWWQAFLARGGQYDLAYLEGPQRFDLRAILPGAQTLLLFRYPYRFREVEEKLRAAPYKVARYAWQKDYHVTLKAKLAEVVQACSLSGRAVTDSAPLAERYWARLAGLGKIGRNGMLIARDSGSYFLIAAVLTEEMLGPDAVKISQQTKSPNDIAEICGECNLCVEACPTAALTGDGLMKTERCISYQTIETRENEVDVSLYKKRHRWIFGCDVCQQVCPHNKTALAFAESRFNDEHPAAAMVASGELPSSRSVRETLELLPPWSRKTCRQPARAQL
jgi:epoxyqueuosine reductase